MQIANIVLQTTVGGTPTELTLAPEFARKDEARWLEDDPSVPLIGRVSLHYARRPADAKTGLVKHSFRATVPTLKSEVTDPAGPFLPAPTLDYVTVAEMNFWVTDRAEEDPRQTIVQLLTDFTVTGANFQALIDDVIRDGRAIY